MCLEDVKCKFQMVLFGKWIKVSSFVMFYILFWFLHMTVELTFEFVSECNTSVKSKLCYNIICCNMKKSTSMSSVLRKHIMKRRDVTFRFLEKVFLLTHTFFYPFRMHFLSEYKISLFCQLSRVSAYLSFLTGKHYIVIHWLRTIYYWNKRKFHT